MFAPWKKSYDRPRHVLKSRDITLLTKVHVIKTMVFPVVMYGCESGTIKKAEHQRLMLSNCGAGEELLRISWTARRINKSILKELNPAYWLEGLMLKLKLQYLGYLIMEELTHWKRPICWERLRAWGEEDDRVWDDWMASQKQWTWVWANSKTVKDREA